MKQRRQFGVNDLAQRSLGGGNTDAAFDIAGVACGTVAGGACRIEHYTSVTQQLLPTGSEAQATGATLEHRESKRSFQPGNLPAYRRWRAALRASSGAKRSGFAHVHQRSKVGQKGEQLICSHDAQILCFVG